MSEEPISISILIVDDDEALLQALPQVIYLRMHDVQVTTCDAAASALQQIQEHDYDAIVSDVKMPGMDGLQLLAQVRTLRPETPVLLITGHGDHDLAIQALRGGAYDYILKPIDRDVFIAALQRAVQTRQLRQKVVEQQLALALHAKSLERLVEKRTSELVAANAQKDKFLNIVSQETHIPLVNLKRRAQLMRHQLEHSDAIASVHQGLVEMEHAIDRTEVLLRDLLDTSLMESNMFLLHRTRCNLLEFCRDLLNEYTSGAGPALTCEFFGEPIIVEVDCNRLKQVVINLLSNARKYSPKGSPITVTVHQSGYEASIVVRDAGVGIPAEALPHIFEQFYRAPGVEVQTGTHTGLGLGLYIARKIVERHGGHIEVQSLPGQGSIFSVSLPLYVDPNATGPYTIDTVVHTQAVWTITN